MPRKQAKEVLLKVLIKNFFELVMHQHTTRIFNIQISNRQPNHKHNLNNWLKKAVPAHSGDLTKHM